MQEQKQDFFDVEKVSKVFADVGKACAMAMNSIINAFKEVVPKVLNTITLTYQRLNNKKVSRKRFIKLLMSKKIQRNEAQKIAKKYYEKQGYYSMFDVFVEWRKKDE